MKFFIQDIKNSIDFFLRNTLVFSRKNFSEDSERVKLENEYLGAVFEKYLTKNDKGHNRILDIGSKNWSYVQSEYDYFKSFCKFELNGIELDAHRVCTNLYSRYEIAKFYTKDLEATNYIVGDLLEHEGEYDYIIWVLPFITKIPHVSWGLPLRYFKPYEMLEKAYSLLNENGELLIINQGEGEYEIQKELIRGLGLEAEFYGEIEDTQGVFRHKRYCSKLRKTSK